jgi:hypothetical protein
VVHDVCGDPSLDLIRVREGPGRQSRQLALVGHEPHAVLASEGLQAPQVEPVGREVEAVDPRHPGHHVAQQRHVPLLEQARDDVAVDPVGQAEADGPVGTRRRGRAHEHVGARLAGVGRVAQRDRVGEVHRLPRQHAGRRQVAPGQVRRQHPAGHGVGHYAVGHRTQERRDEANAKFTQFVHMLPQVAQPSGIVEAVLDRGAHPLDRPVAVAVAVAMAFPRGPVVAGLLISDRVADQQRVGRH